MTRHNLKAGEEYAQKFIAGEPVFNQWQSTMVGYMLIHDVKALCEIANQFPGTKCRTRWDAMYKILNFLAAPQKVRGGSRSRQWLVDALKKGVMWPQVENFD